MNYTLEVLNVKCGGCANNIRSNLSKLAGVEKVAVDIPAGKVMVEAAEGLRENISSTLATLGYPEKSK